MRCGTIHYSAQPVRTMACHCSTCKKRTGAAYGVGVYFNESDVTISQGDLGIHEFHADTSGRWIRNEFCTKCGSTISWTLEMRPGLRAIAGGCYDDPNWFSIEVHIWTRSARPDMCYPADMPQYEKALS